MNIMVKQNSAEKRLSPILLYGSSYFGVFLTLVGIFLIYFDQFRTGLWFLMASIIVMMPTLLILFFIPAFTPFSLHKQLKSFPNAAKWFIGPFGIALLLGLYLIALKAVAPWCGY